MSPNHTRLVVLCKTQKKENRRKGESRERASERARVFFFFLGSRVCVEELLLCRGFSSAAMAKQKEEGSGEWEDKAENAWSYYTAQAQEIGRKALQSKDDALKTAKSQLGQLQDASSHHLTTAQVCKSEHSHFTRYCSRGEKLRSQKKKSLFFFLGTCRCYMIWKRNK